MKLMSCKRKTLRIYIVPKLQENVGSGEIFMLVGILVADKNNKVFPLSKNKCYKTQIGDFMSPHKSALEKKKS